MKDEEEASRTVTKHVRAGTPYLGNLRPIKYLISLNYPHQSSF